MDLKNIKKSKTFYDDRYLKGYMEEWPTKKKLRISRIIKSLHLPEYGEALDFGCGNGVFSDVLKKALPHWNVYGCDISKTAIQNASKRFPNYHFFENSDRRYLGKQFDFVFTHHVLEHVFNIQQIAQQFTRRTKKSASMLHILPCGNMNSFEYRLCTLIPNGINKKIGNRFYFEDDGHIRRMTTAQCSKLFKRHHFILKQNFYSNQYFGALDWITQSLSSLIFAIFNPFQGKDLLSKTKLTLLLIEFLLIHTFRTIAIHFDRISKIHNKKTKHILFISIFWLPSKLLIPFERYIQFLADNEWNKRKKQENGSEMYLYYTKTT